MYHLQYERYERDNRDRILPGRLCQAGPSNLLFVNTAKKPNEVRWLDCTKLPPKPIDRKTIQLKHNAVHDMCYVLKNNKELVVYSSKEGIFAQNVKTSENEWAITKTARGSLKSPCAITTDGRGHIFLSDPQNSVVLIVSSDGVELGTVMDLRDIGTPGPICWSESLLSLVIVYKETGVQGNHNTTIVVNKLGKIAN